MWGIQEAQATLDRAGPPNHAAMLQVGDEVSEVTVPVANKPNEVPPPCPEVPITTTGLRNLVVRNGRVLHCDDGGTGRIEWPRHACHRVDHGTVVQHAPGAPAGDYVICSPAPQPTVPRVLVVDGRPILLTDEPDDPLALLRSQLRIPATVRVPHDNFPIESDRLGLAELLQ